MLQKPKRVLRQSIEKYISTVCAHTYTHTNTSIQKLITAS